MNIKRSTHYNHIHTCKLVDKTLLFEKNKGCFHIYVQLFIHGLIRGNPPTPKENPKTRLVRNNLLMLNDGCVVINIPPEHHLFT